MKKLISYSTILIIFFISFSLYAQEEKLTTAGAEFKMVGLEKPIIPEEYILMPGDAVLVTITGATNYSYETWITYEGKITIETPVTSIPMAQGLYVPKYDVVAAVPIYNLTLNTAKDSLKKVFAKYFRNIDVDITLYRMRTFTVFVIGEVNKPGMVFARPIDRVSTVIDSVGNITAIGSYSKIELRRGGELFKLVDLDGFKRTGNTEVNPYVQDGDLIYVPRMEKSVIVIGAIFGKREYEERTSEIKTIREELATPGEKTSKGLYELIEGETVSDIIAKAVIAPWADLTSVYIEREDKKIKINLTHVFADENSEENILMEDGDVLNIPSINAVVYVEGRVVNPGCFNFQPNLRASDFIGLAGGPLPEASMSGAYVKRGRKKISIKKDPVIEKEDRIFVPRQIFKFWQDYVEIGAVFASLLISYLTLVK